MFAQSGSALSCYTLTNFRKALEILDDHRMKKGHQDAVVHADAFLSVMDDKRDNIVVQTNQALAQKIQANRHKLASLIKTIILCGRQNFALRGHRDAAIICNGQCTSETPRRLGNFWALLDFRIDAGDMSLAEHLISARGNATYTSGQIQNELIDIIGRQIRQYIDSRVQQAKWFTVIANEVTDASTKNSRVW